MYQNGSLCNYADGFRKKVRFMKRSDKQNSVGEQVKILKSDRRYSAFLFVPAYIFLAWLLLFHLEFTQPVAEKITSVRHYENVCADGNTGESLMIGEKKNFGTVDVSDSDGRFELNSASEKLLEELPGIGPEKAKRIAETRTKMNGFRTVDDLRNVEGIGEKTFDKIKDILYISD